MSTEMTASEIEDFLSPTRIAVLGTINKDGTPSLNPVWYLWDDGAIHMIINRTDRYGRNVLRDQRITVCVQQEASPYKGFLASGTAEVRPDTEAGMLPRLAKRYFGEERGTQYAANAWKDHGDTLLWVSLRPSTVSSWDYGKR